MQQKKSGSTNNKRKVRSGVMEVLSSLRMYNIEKHNGQEELGWTNIDMPLPGHDTKSEYMRKKNLVQQPMWRIFLGLGQ